MMRPPRCWLIGVCFIVAASGTLAAADPDADEILTLDGDKLFDAAKKIQFDDKPKLSTADLVRITQKLASSRNKGAKQDDWKFLIADFFKSACDKAGAKELDDLIQIYTDFDFDSFEKHFALEKLAALWVKVELASAGPDLQKISLPDAAPSAPPELKDAPHELIAAWQTYKRALQAFEKTFPWDSNRASISYQSNSHAFFKIIDEVLLKRGEGSAERLQEFGWNGPSGTFSETLTEPQAMGVLMALLHEGRIAEAVGAAIRLEGDRPLTTGETDIRIEFWKRCGLDWEALLAGREIDVELKWPWFATYHNPCLEELAVNGSDHAASLVAMMARRAKPELQEAYAHAISTFMPKDPKNETHFLNGVSERIAKEPISKPLQVTLITILQEFAKPNASEQVAAAALDGFARAKSPGTKATLYALTKHPSARVVREATEVLQAMGENISYPTELPAVRFRIFANGKPLASDSLIGWEVGGISTSTEVEKDGTISIEREYFQDPQRKVSKVKLESRPYKTPEGPTFMAELPVPPDLNSVTRVDVDLCSLQLHIRDVSRNDVAKDRSAAVTIQRHQNQPQNSDDEVHVYFERLKRKFDTPIDQPVNLSMQPGFYDLELRVSGAAGFTQKIEVAKDVSPLEIQLQSGSDVHFRVARPDGEDHARMTLLKDGREMNLADLEKSFDFQTMTFRSLPCGNYVLHFPSSAEVRAQDGEYGYAPAGIAYAEHDVPFVIKTDSPPLIDLGTINLEAASK